MPTNKSEVALLQLISFHINLLPKGIIALWVSYSFTKPVFHTFPFLHCERHKAEILKVDFNKCLIQV
jgi:hypothetical protein